MKAFLLSSTMLATLSLAACAPGHNLCNLPPNERPLHCYDTKGSSMDRSYDRSHNTTPTETNQNGEDADNKPTKDPSEEDETPTDTKDDDTSSDDDDTSSDDDDTSSDDDDTSSDDDDTSSDDGDSGNDSPDGKTDKGETDKGGEHGDRPGHGHGDHNHDHSGPPKHDHGGHDHGRGHECSHGKG